MLAITHKNAELLIKITNGKEENDNLMTIAQSFTWCQPLPEP